MATKVKIHKSRLMCGMKLITIVTLSVSITQAQVQVIVSAVLFFKLKYLYFIAIVEGQVL